jgi:glycogen synthase
MEMRISVVINTYNRCQSLRTTLNALTHQVFKNFEVVVVNGPSTDGSEEMLEEWAGRIVHVRCPEVNISKSRNIGIQAASGDIVAFIDDDAIPEPDWLLHLSKPYENPIVAGVGGIVWDHTGVKLQYRFSFCDYMGRTKFTYEQPNFIEVNKAANQFIYLQGTNSSFRKSILHQIGGFDEEIEYFHDETDVAARVHQLGLALAPLTVGGVHHKYLASHLRTEERTILEPYPIVKNSYYFGLINGKLRYETDLILQHLVQYVAGVRNHATRALREGRMDRAQFDYFQQRVDSAIVVGTERGLSGFRKLGTFSALSESRFVPFETKNPASKRLTVCFVSNEYPPKNFGGIGRFTRDLAEELASRGHQIHVVTKGGESSRIDWEQGVWMHRLSSGTNRLSGPEINAIPYKWNLLHSAMVYEEVTRLNERFQIDAISSPLWSSEGLLCQMDDSLPTILSLMTSQKTIGEIDPKHSKSETWKQQVALEKHSVRCTKFIHAISDAILKKTLKDFGPTEAKAAISYLGVRDESPRFTRTRSVDDDTLRILCVGRLEPRKGTDLFLAAAEKVCKSFSNVQFVLVGNDSNHEKSTSYQSKLERKAPHLIHDKKVVFVGSVTDDELYAEYANADIFVLPSRFESFGLVLLEAMSFGLPVIGARIGGMEEIVRDGENGLLMEPGSAASLAEKLAMLVQDGQLRKRMSENSRNDFDAKWSIQKAGDRTEACYSEFAALHATTRLRDDLNLEQQKKRMIDKLVTVTSTDRVLTAVTQNVARILLDPNKAGSPLREVSLAWFRKPKRFVQKTYKAILNRPADDEAIAYFLKQLDSGKSRLQIVVEIATSPEAKALGVPSDWFEELPNTTSIERMPLVFRAVGTAKWIPTLWQRDGVIRTELRRRKKRKYDSQRKAA